MVTELLSTSMETTSYDDNMDNTVSSQPSLVENTMTSDDVTNHIYTPPLMTTQGKLNNLIKHIHYLNLYSSDKEHRQMLQCRWKLVL